MECEKRFEKRLEAIVAAMGFSELYHVEVKALMEKDRMKTERVVRESEVRVVCCECHWQTPHQQDGRGGNRHIETWGVTDAEGV